MNKENIILASSSPRRIELFKKHGFNPIIISPEVDEIFNESLSVEQTAMYLALKKGLAVEREVFKDKALADAHPFIVSADTIVYKEKIIGKPVNHEDAFQILKSLRNNSHFVITGVAIIQADTARRKLFYETTEVFFKDYSDDVINDYIESEEVLDKAGSYAIQSEIWGKNIDKIVGDYDNVMGFPWNRFINEYGEFGT